MIKHYLWLLFLCNLQSNSFTLLDKESGLPIRGARAIFYFNSSIHSQAVSTKFGKFDVLDNYDSISIIHENYQKLTIFKTLKRNQKLYLTPKYLQLDEVKIEKDRILGNYKEKTKEFVYVLQKKNLALLFENKTGESFRLGSLYLNMKNVPYKTNITLQFFTTDTITKGFMHNSKIKERKVTELTDIIPNEKNIIGITRYNLSPGQDNVVEIDLSNEHIPFPKGGLFVSIISNSLFDHLGVRLDNPTLLDLPTIYLHKTKNNNYCSFINDNASGHWVNNNIHQKYANEKHVMVNLFQPYYYEPSIAISLKKNY